MDYLIDQLEKHGDSLAVARGEETTSYSELLSRFHGWRRRLANAAMPPGSVVSVEGEYATDTIAAFLAVIQARHIAVPLSSDSKVRHAKFLTSAQVEWRIELDCDECRLTRTGTAADHPLYRQLREAGHPGLVLFTSGSTGENKAAVHDCVPLLEKFHTPRRQLRTLVFLQLDHIGGVNTLLYALANGGTVVVPSERSAAAVCAAIARHRVELLPTSPTFLNLLLLSEEYQRHDLSSLHLITYGTEPMPLSTLQRLHEAFPDVKLQQTYGMTEFGILRSKSRDSGSLWVRVGGEGFETKVVDGRLWVRARSAMLGYLNAPNPFDADGFLDTGDRVEVDGDWLRILGRDSEIINVGGSKVFPAEVESVLLDLAGVADVAVRGEPHPLTGQIVSATVKLTRPEPLPEFKLRMRQHCRNQLPPYAVPARVQLTDSPLYTERFKRRR
ncbi:ANL family adenylate-forming protein [Desulfonatronum thioautotrophicum]|uniref:ANL family adenylate-forming protein n=1 Tax=Desulfonatronum thioautotrophicum TaxID=617001 RepID=UPI0005EB0994|nr:fatty acid--CoA ligase family protein [Desulfonatronum thioautotrophicum]